MANVERSDTLAAKIRNACRTLALRRNRKYRGNRPISERAVAAMRVAKQEKRLEITK